MLTLDGNWIDIGSLISGGCIVLLSSYIKTQHAKVKFISKETAKRFADGIAIFPLMLLAVSPLSSQIIHDFETSSRLTMAISGVFGLFAILEDIF